MRLRYTAPALADLEAVGDYVSSRSPDGARNVLSRIRQGTELIMDHPRVGSPTDVPDIRRMTTPPYPHLIFYEVAGDDVVIHAIRHAARDPAGMPGRNPS